MQPSRVSRRLLQHQQHHQRRRQQQHQQLLPWWQRRCFHDYFVTHLPSSSMHPDSRSSAGPRHNLPRDQSKPHSSSSRSPASWVGHTREMTVVRIPLKSAKHHFGAHCGRGTRLYNEDAYQAGTVDLPAFARKPPVSLIDRRKRGPEPDGAENAEGATGDPQVFYFGVFDGHGGDKCSHWLRDSLHRYIEESAARFHMASTLQIATDNEVSETTDEDGDAQLQLTNSWRETVGGYFRRFKPDHLPVTSGGRGQPLQPSNIRSDKIESPSYPTSPDPEGETTNADSLESILTYSFLLADLDFITDNKSLKNVKAPTSLDDPSTGTTSSSAGTNNSSTSNTAQQEESHAEEQEDPLGRHSHHSSQPFIGGSTCSLALISTPTPTPFWHPATPFTIVTAHVGDTRIILCSTATGAPIPVTPTHHPSSPGEARRLRRYAAAFTTDSFGEERISGLANTRAFGDRRSKRVGVSAEPALTLVHAAAAQFSFMVLVSDGVTGVLSDQEIVDVVKEARTPEQGSRDVVSLATEISSGEQGDADNATCVCVRLGGWERRSEGGVGSLGTRENREWRKQEAADGARRRT